MILPRAKNGIQLVYSIVCNFNGIVLFNSSNICINFKVDNLEVSHTSKNSPESKIASIRLKFLVLKYQSQDQGVNLFCPIGRHFSVTIATKKVKVTSPASVKQTQSYST